MEVSLENPDTLAHFGSILAHFGTILAHFAILGLQKVIKLQFFVFYNLHMTINASLEGSIIILA